MSANIEFMKLIRHIGVDLDNTLIDYSRSFTELGREFGFKENSTRESIRKELRRNDGADDVWQEFQSLLYTRGLEFAELAPYSRTFLKIARENNINISIVSHKSSTTQERFGGHDLRGPALEWLRKKELMPQIVDEMDVHFASTQNEKIEKVFNLKVDLFIDDLDEVIEKLNVAASLKTWHFSLNSKQHNSGDFRSLMDKFGFSYES